MRFAHIRSLLISTTFAREIQRDFSTFSTECARKNKICASLEKIEKIFRISRARTFGREDRKFKEFKKVIFRLSRANIRGKTKCELSRTFLRENRKITFVREIQTD